MLPSKLILLKLTFSLNMMKSHAVLIHLAWDANHPFTQCIDAVYTPC
jgi:hypothetical protein